MEPSVQKIWIHPEVLLLEVGVDFKSDAKGVELIKAWLELS